MLQVQGGEPRCSPAKPWSENTGEPGRHRRWYVWGRGLKRNSYWDRKNDSKCLMSPLGLYHLITHRWNSTRLGRNNFWGKNDDWRPMHWVGLDAMIFVFWTLSFKPTFSLSTFTFIKRLLSSSSLSAIGWCHLHIWGDWYFSQQSWFQFVLHWAQHFSWCTLHIS